VSDGSPAQAAGLQRGDLITAVGDDAVDDPTGLEAALAGLRPGDTVTVAIVRGTAELTLTVTFPAADDTTDDTPEDAPTDG
jgi:putative serine protease PepD